MLVQVAMANWLVMSQRYEGKSLSPTRLSQVAAWSDAVRQRARLRFEWGVRSSVPGEWAPRFEARNGRWGLIADLFYANLSQSRATPLGLLFSRARIETEAKALSAYAAYRIHEDDRVSVDLLAGLRVNSLDIDLSLSPGLLRGQSFGIGETWVDPLIGGRLRFAITDHWFATAFADVGGVDVGSDLTWQVFASLGYQFSERWSVQGGWRHVAIDKEIDGRDVENDFSGPLLGFTARF